MFTTDDTPATEEQMRLFHEMVERNQSFLTQGGFRQDDPEIAINLARKVARANGGESQGRCCWLFTTKEQCPLPIQHAVFFCPTHVGLIHDFDAVWVRTAWGRLQDEAAEARTYQLACAEETEPK